jgi:hypothetical protein
MIVRSILVVVFVLAVWPRTRPTTFRVLGTVARAVANALVLIWATSLLRPRRPL